MIPLVKKLNGKRIRKRRSKGRRGQDLLGEVVVQGCQLNDTRGSASALSARRRHVTLTAGLATHTTGSARSPVRPIYLDAGSSGTFALFQVPALIKKTHHIPSYKTQKPGRAKHESIK
jgi:hypothetical protein